MPFPLPTQRRDKPHLFFYDGFWRVTLWDRDRSTLPLWVVANNHAERLNAHHFNKGGK